MGGFDELLVVETGLVATGYHRYPDRGHQALGVDLVTHGLYRRRRGTHEDDPRFQAGPRQGRVLGQEAVTRVESIGPGPAGGVDYRAYVQVSAGGPEVQSIVRLLRVHGAAVQIRVDSRAADTHSPQGPYDPNRDLAAVGDQDGVEQLPHILNTP